MPHAGGLVVEACDHLVNHLPVTLDGLRSRVVAPKSPQVHAWGSPPVVMRCGVPRPPGFSTSSPETVTVNGIVWFQRTSGDTVIWTAIRPQADVELAVPMSYAAQGGYLVELATALKAAAAS